MYHGVTDDQLAITDWCQVSAEHFRQQLEVLSHQHRVLPLAEVIDRMSKNLPLPNHTACLTFDDGFQNFYDTAYPLLRRYQIPSTQFLITSLMESRLPAWPGQVHYALSCTSLPSIHFLGTEWQLKKGLEGELVYGRMVGRLKSLGSEERDKRVAELTQMLGAGHPMDFEKAPRATMGWRQVEELTKEGLVSFESHTHTHPSLSACPPEEQHRELQISRDIMRERVPAQDLLCYPFGDHTPATKSIAAELGYRCALATTPGLSRPDADLYSVHRVGVGAGMATSKFEMAMMGWFK